MPTDYPLEVSGVEQEALIQAAMERVLDHLEGVAEQPASGVEGASEVASAFDEPIPKAGNSVDAVLDRLFEEAIPASINTIHPGFLAYIPGGGLFHSAVADFVSNATNRYVGSWFAAPALVQIEASVINWFCDMIGYPAEAFGVLTTGGSMANLTAMITARRERLPQDFLDGMVYTSDQSHHSVSKAAVLAGFPPENVRKVPTGPDYRIDVEALESMVEADREAGRTPFFVVANAGTTNTGAVDDLVELADFCESEGLWLHADAAYGGFFVLTEVGTRRLAGLNRCDSVTLDPHKGLFLPYGTGALLVRDEETLGRAHAVNAEYMPDIDASTAEEIVDFSQLSPELSRDFRGLRVWLPFQLHGVDAFRTALEEKLDLAAYAADELASIESVEVVAEPELSTLAFRVVVPNVSEETLDELNREVLKSVNRRGNVYLSGTTLEGKFVIRVSVLSFRTHAEHIDHCIADVAAAIDEVLEE